MEKLETPDAADEPSISHLDPPAASLLKRGILYARRKLFGMRLDPELRDKALDLFRLVKPMRAVGVPKVRVGASRDGGYVMLDDFDKVSCAYSIGIGSDVSWDLSLAARGLSVFQFDHTIVRPPATHPLFHFEQLGLGTETDPVARLDTLPNMLGRGSNKPGQPVLKMDVEGAEWKILDGLGEAVLPNFRQIVCEFHNLHEMRQKAWYDRAFRVFSRLNKTHQAVHIHRNNWGPRIWVDDVEIPFFAEITFALRTAYPFETTDEAFPGQYDLSSAPLFPDRPLAFLRQF